MARPERDKMNLTEGEVKSTIAFLTGGKLQPDDIVSWVVVIQSTDAIGILSDECTPCTSRLLLRGMASMSEPCEGPDDSDND